MLTNVTSAYIGWRYVFEALWPQCRNEIKVVKENATSYILLLRGDIQSEDIRQ